MTNFKELLIWQKAFAIGVRVLKLTKDFPKHEQYGLASQMNRSAVSIASNIAEGAGRESKKEFERFLDYSVGSSYELETQLLFALELEYIKKEDCDSLQDELSQLLRMIRKFKEKLKD